MVRGPPGNWKHRLYHFHTTAGSSVPASIVPHQQLLFLLTTKRSWRSILRKRKNSNNSQAMNPIRGYKNCYDLRMIHHFLIIAWLTTRFTLPKIYSAWLFPSGGGDLKFYTEGLYPQVKSLTYFFKKKSALWRSSPFAYKAFLRG